MSTAPPVARQAAPPRGARLRADLALLAVAGIWGATFVMVKDALASAGPFAFLAVRFSLATLLMAPLLLATSRRAAWDQRVALAGLLVGVALFAGYALQTVGLQFTTPARAAFITGFSVVLVPLLASRGLGRPAGRGVWAGVALATAGLALLALGPDLLAGGPLLAADTALGDVVVLGGAVAFAAQIALVGHFSPRHGTVPLTLAQLGAAAALGSAFAIALERPAPWQLGAILPAAAFTGVFATVAAFTIQVRAQRFTTPTHTALIFATEPVFGALFAYLLAGEVFSPPAVLGALLILVGMVVAQVAE